MMKLVSFFIFVAAFVWTWSLLTTKSTIGIDIHAGIQSKLAILIQEAIKAKRPNSTNFELNKIYTEKIDDNKIKAYFAYKFVDTLEDLEKSEQTISGQAILNRSLSEDPNVQKWVIQSVKTDSNAIEFKEGLVISSDENDTVKPIVPNTSAPEKTTH